MGFALGAGRPGRHIECSAMAEKFLGEEFEIHGGGIGLPFPHHENELAQSRSLGHGFARIWMHNGMLELDAAKMSKSLGNVVTLRNVLDTWGREALLVFHLSGFWSKPVDFDDEVMAQAAARAERFRDVFRNPHEPAPDGSWERFAAALEDDFDTPAALAVVHEWRATICFGALSAPSASSPSLHTPRRRRKSSSSRSSARPLAYHATSRKPIVSAERSRPPAGRHATKRADTASCLCGDARARLRSERGARALPRAAPGARSLGHGACRSSDPLARRRPARAGQAGAGMSEAAGTRDHQGIVVWCEPFRYADAYELAKTDSPLLVCLDQVTDPHNLGAVIRSPKGRVPPGSSFPRTAQCVSPPWFADRRQAQWSTCLSRWSPTLRATSPTSRGRACGPMPPTPKDRDPCGTPT